MKNVKEKKNFKSVVSYIVHQGSLKGFYNHILSILKHLQPELIFIVTFLAAMSSSRSDDVTKCVRVCVPFFFL